METAKPSVLVIGAGFSGLSTAYYLVQKGLAVEIHEKSGQVGGLISTEILPEMQVESAANAFLASLEIENMSKEIGVPLIPALDSARKRFIFWNGMRRWPLSFFESLIVFKLVLKFLFFGKKVLPLKQESIESWGQRVCGKFLVEKLMGPALQGIYAGEPKFLSASLILNPIFNSNKRIRKGELRGSVSPKMGMGEFTHGLAKYLQGRGVKIFLNSEIDLNSASDSKKYSSIVIATNAHTAMKLLDFANPIEMLDVVRGTLAWKLNKPSIGGFGVLFARNNGFRSLGALSNSEIFSNRGSCLNESWILGGASDPAATGLKDAELQNLILQERKKLLNTESEVAASRYIRWPKGLPHYTVELEKFLEQLRPQTLEWEEKRAIYLVGNYLGSLGLSRLLEANKATAERIIGNVQRRITS